MSSFRKIPALLLAFLLLAGMDRPLCVPAAKGAIGEKGAALLQSPAPGPSPTPSPSPTLSPSPSPSPTPSPTPSPSPVLRAEDGLLSAPDHPVYSSAGLKIFVGDSRTVMMRNAVGDDGNIWSAKVAMGYDWMSSTGVPDIEGYIGPGTAVIFLMGVNDPGNLPNYINYINAKAEQWAGLGASTYFVSVGPVSGDPYVTNAEIEAFNAGMQAGLAGVSYIDIYSYLTANGYATTDGTHYPDDISVSIYRFILDHISAPRMGLWA